MSVWIATYVMAALLAVFNAPPVYGVPGNTFTEFTRNSFGHPMVVVNFCGEFNKPSEAVVEWEGR